MKTFIDYYLPLALVAIFLGLITWWNISLWEECRATNSFWYCVRVLSR